jgi:hypothetical protein
MKVTVASAGEGRSGTVAAKVEDQGKGIYKVSHSLPACQPCSGFPLLQAAGHIAYAGIPSVAGL